MIDTLFGIKKNMTSSYDARGRRIGATILEIAPNLVTQVKTTEGKDGYNAIQLGLSQRKNLKKPQLGHLKKAGIESKIRWLREAKTSEPQDLKPGTAILLNQVFSVGDSVKVQGVSKGKGFAGGIKRHGFHGGPKTHGQSDRHRAPGSVGPGTTPGRVLKGKHMAGHMGAETASIKNLEVLGIDRANNLLTVKGGVPGHIGTLLMITKLGRIKGYIPPPDEKPDEEEVKQEAKTSEVVEGEKVSDNPVIDEVTEQPADAQAPQDALSKEGVQDAS